MKKAFNLILLFAMALLLVVPFAFGQDGSGTSETSNVVNTVSYIFNAVLAAVLYFVNGARERAKETGLKAESKLNAVVSFWYSLKDALADEKLTPEELKRLAEAGEKIIK